MDTIKFKSKNIFVMRDYLTVSCLLFMAILMFDIVARFFTFYSMDVVKNVDMMCSVSSFQFVFMNI